MRSEPPWGRLLTGLAVISGRLAREGPLDRRLLLLRGQWVAVSVVSVAAVGFSWGAVANRWGGQVGVRWLVVTVGFVAVPLGLLWSGLTDNRHPDEGILRPRLGLGNVLSLTRGIAIALLGGFLVIPHPRGLWWWVPGGLYASAVLLDALDGWVARRHEEATVLGERLDLELDSLGLLVGSLLGIHYGQLPTWYLAVGLARYAFVAGRRYRHWRGRSVAELPPSSVRRLLAVGQMLIIAGALLPTFTPPLTTVVATIAMLPFLAGFLRDWLAICGREMGYH